MADRYGYREFPRYGRRNKDRGSRPEQGRRSHGYYEFTSYGPVENRIRVNKNFYSRKIASDFPTTTETSAALNRGKTA